MTIFASLVVAVIMVRVLGVHRAVNIQLIDERQLKNRLSTHKSKMLHGLYPLQLKSWELQEM